MSDQVALRRSSQAVRICPPAPPTRLTTMNVGGWLGFYPYTRTDALTFRPVTRRYRSVTLENRYLRATIIPELGAHLYSLFDRINRQECFVTPELLRYGRVHLRGAWYPLGLECNFPRGHTVSTAWPVQWACKRSEDGSATISIAAYHWCTRMHWEVDFTLHPDDARLHVHTRLANPTDVPYGYMYWANAAVWMSHDFRMQVRATMGDVGGDVIPFPVAQGRDYTWYRSRLHSSDLFAIALGQSWFGGYDHGRRHGVVHVADPDVMQGKKFFSWGHGEDGLIWSRIFGMNGEHYGEIQAGLKHNQGMVDRMDSGQSLEFDEIWYPVADTGDITAASESLAVGVVTRRARPASPELRLLSPIPVPNAKLEVIAGRKTLLSRPLRLVPGQCKVIGLPTWPEKQPMRAVVRRGRHILLEGDLQPAEQANQAERSAFKKARLDALPKDAVGKARMHLDLNSDNEAERLLKQARRQKSDPLELALAGTELHLRRFEHEQALAGLQKVRPARRDARWHAALADVLTRLGHIDQAEVAYRKAAKSKPLQTRALAGAARCQARKGSIDTALVTVSRLAKAAPEDPAVGLLRARLLGMAGNLRGAKEELDRLAQRWPAHPGLDAELWLLADGEAAARSAWQNVIDRCAGDADWFLEIAWDLAHLGAVEDAAILLRRTIQEKPFAQSPMLLITLAWWLREESPAESSQLLDRAAEADWAAGAPHRWESIGVLDWACRQRPKSGRFLYWRGCLSNRRMDRTAAQTYWRQAVQREPRLAGARRNLGYLLFRDRRSKEAWEHYRVALAGEPNDSHLVEEASQVLCHLGRLRERVAMLKRALTRKPKCDKILRLLATALRDVGNYGESLKVMTRNEFSPWEGEQTLKLCFYECHTALARLAMKSGKLEQAEKHFRASLCLPPTMGHARSHRGNDAHALYGLGLTEWARGRWSAAQELWEQAASRRFPVGWSEGAISPVEIFSAALANLRIGRRAGAHQLAEQMLESVRVVIARRKRRRGDLRAETYGWDPYRAPEQEALAHLILGDKRKAVSSFELVLDCYGPHDATVGRLALIDPAGPWQNRGAYEMEWLGMAL